MTRVQTRGSILSSSWPAALKGQHSMAFACRGTANLRRCAGPGDVRGYLVRRALDKRRIVPMNTRPSLTAADARKIAAAAEQEALANGWAVSIAVVDDGGHVWWLQRLDGAPPISAQIAPAKACTAAVGRRESKVYEDMINQGRVSFLSAPAARHARRGRADHGRGPMCRCRRRQRREVEPRRADRARRHRGRRGLTRVHVARRGDWRASL